MVWPYNLLLTVFNLHAASDIAYCHCPFLIAPGQAIGKVVTLGILVINKSNSGKGYQLKDQVINNNKSMGI